MTCPCLRDNYRIRRKRATCMAGKCIAGCPGNCKEGFCGYPIYHPFLIIVVLLILVAIGYLYYR